MTGLSGSTAPAGSAALAGRRAIVTGGASGIGLECAEAFAEALVNNERGCLFD